MIFSFPSVRDYFGRKFTEKIREQYGIDIQIDKANPFPPGDIRLEGLLIRDHRGDTLIYAGKVQTAWKNFWHFDFSRIIFGDTYLIDTKLIMRTYKGEKDDNLSVFADKLDNGDSGGGGHFYMRINKVRLKHFTYRLYNENIKREPLLGISDAQISIKPFLIDGKRVQVNVARAEFKDQYGHNIRKFNVDYVYYPDSMQIKNLLLETDQSKIAGDIRLRYSRENLKHFFDEVALEGNLKGRVSGRDINVFGSDTLFSPGEKIDFRSAVAGYFNELEWNDLHLETTTGIQWDGEAVLYNLTETDSIGIHAFFDNFSADRAALAGLMPGTAKKYLPESVEKLGKFSLRGDLRYAPSLLTEKLTLTSAGGETRSDLRFYWPENSPSVYAGNIAFVNFNLGKLLGVNDLGNVTGKVAVSGKGFDYATMRGKMKAGFSRIEWKKYPYAHVKADVSVKNKLLSGNVRIDDKRAKMLLDGKIALGKHSDNYDLSLRIPSWDLYKTHWISGDTLNTLAGAAHIRLQGKNPDDWTGKIRFDSIFIHNSKDKYRFRNFNVTSEIIEGEHLLQFQSEHAVNGYMRGKFTMEHLPQLFRKIGSAVFASLGKNLENKAQNIRFNLDFDNNFLELIDPSISYTDHLKLKGKVNEKTGYVHLDLKSNKLFYKGLKIFKPLLSIDNSNPIYNLYVKSDSVRAAGYVLHDIRAINLMMRDTVYMKLKATGNETKTDTFDLAAYYVLDSVRNFRLGLMPSLMKVNGTDWTVNPEQYPNRIDYDLKKDSLHLDRIVISHGNEYLKINGYQTPEDKNISLIINELELSHILPGLETLSFEGLVNGQILMQGNKSNSFYKAALNIRDFVFNNTPLGVLNLQANTLKNRVMFLQLSTLKDGKKSMDAIGYTDLQQEDLDINVNLSDFPLKPLNKMLTGVLDHIRGSGSGHFTITGKWSNPQYNGTIRLYRAGLRVAELNTDYVFKDNSALSVVKDRFVFNNVHFTDTAYHTAGTLNGNISFYNFSNWYVDLHLNADNLLVLNTKQEPEVLYYGKAFVSGQGRIYGYMNKINIDAKVKSRSGTSIYIPLTDVETVGEDDFIKFYTAETYRHKRKNGTRRPQKVYEGLNMNLDIDMTPDAQVEIVLDQQFGSKLQARGNGTILMEINTEGKFNMWGSYRVEEGSYFFRYAGVIDKKFDVEPGSSLTWNGDPFRADLDIKAVYHIPAADISPLLQDEYTVSKKIPVDVIILIKGDLMKPRIDFKVDVPKTNSIIASELEYALSEPDKRMLQVVSLLYSGTFISEDVLKFNNKAAVEGNLSERVLGVFNSLLENDIFNVKLNYVPGQQNPETNVTTATQVGLTLQTKINKRIYINGKLAMPVGRYTRSSVTGDIEANIWLTPDGNLQLRLFNKRTEIEYVDQKESYTQGLGLFYQVNFDTFKEFAEKLGFKIETKK